jgi:hypothetical protein
MLPLRYAVQWRVGSIILLLCVFGAMLMPAVWFWPDRSGLLKWFIGVDKWLHAIIFVALAIWFAGLYERRLYVRIAIGLIVFGILIEGGQRLVTYRSAEWYDIVADAVGIFVGFTVAAMGAGAWGLRVEERFLRAKAANRVD